MRSFNGSVLMSDAAIVATGFHTVMGTKGFVAIRHIASAISIDIAECSRKTVCAVITRCTTQRPKSILQTSGQGSEAFTAFHNLGMLKTTIGKTEVIEQIVEGRPSNCNLKARCMGKV